MSKLTKHQALWLAVVVVMVGSSMTAFAPYREISLAGNFIAFVGGVLYGSAATGFRDWLLGAEEAPA